MTKRIFYKTKIVIEILSEEPQSVNSLADIEYDITEGNNSGSWNVVETMELNGLACANELKSQGTDPEFFQIDDDGNDLLNEGDDVEVENEDGTTWIGTILDFREDIDGSTIVVVEGQDGDVLDVSAEQVTIYN